MYTIDSSTLSRDERRALNSLSRASGTGARVTSIICDPRRPKARSPHISGTSYGMETSTGSWYPGATTLKWAGRGYSWYVPATTVVYVRSREAIRRMTTMYEDGCTWDDIIASERI